MKLLVCLFLLTLVLPAWGDEKWQFGIDAGLWYTEAGLGFRGDDGVDSVNVEDFLFGTYDDPEAYISLGGLARKGRWFFKLDYYLETKFSGTSTDRVLFLDSDEFGNVAGFGVLPGPHPSALERTDIDLTIGFNWPNGWSVFGGYEDLSYDESLANDEGTFLFVTPNEVTVYAFEDLSLTNTNDLAGYFVGLGYAYQFSGVPISLGGSLAYTDLSGSSRYAFNIAGFDLVNNRFNADADGISAKIAFSYHVNNHWRLTLGYRGQYYDPSGSTTEGGVSVEIGDLESQGLQLNVSYQF